MAERMVRHRARAGAAGRRVPDRRGEMSDAGGRATDRSQVALEPALDRQRDLPALLRHDHCDGVVLLGQADRGTVARPEITADNGVDGERQEARRRRDAILLQYYCAIVKGRGRLKDGDEQVVGHLGVEGNPALDVVPQPDFTLDGDDRAGLMRRQHRRRHDHFFDCLVGGLLTVEIAEERRATEVACAAGVGLEITMPQTRT